ncbi:hypothetical protein TSO221_18040 [Azospirillum sp. TSO22-1]|nr:hypothetical protein TSO221_18040 [Azospirillum sp. TSO22-1]
MPPDCRVAQGGLRCAFVPIVQARTGACHGFEMSLRGMETVGFSTHRALSDAAFRRGVLAEFEAAVATDAIAAFRALAPAPRARLFIPVDARCFGSEVLLGVLADGVAAGVPLTVALPEQDVPALEASGDSAFARCAKANVGVALWNLGSGGVGLRALCDLHFDCVRIDDALIQGIDRNMRKRTAVNHIVGCAHTLGTMAIAGGVGSEVEFYVSRDVGCDFVQGPLVAPPGEDGPLAQESPVVVRLNREDRRRPSEALQRLSAVIERLPPLPVASPKAALLDYFSDERNPAVVPVVDDDRRPLGLIRERDLKRFVYSRFGSELLRNKAFGRTLRDLVVACPVCDINTPLEQVIEAFTTSGAADGVIIVECGEYAGYLGSNAIVRLVHERTLIAATDQNPLTRMPGNAAITRHIEMVLEGGTSPYLLVYFDFDNFKPFNDTFGFRQGDRALLMFAERLKAWAGGNGGFAGHIGGDDFFLAVGGVDERSARAQLGDLVEGFRSDAESLYDPASRAAGFITATDRYGSERTFPLLTVSGVAVLLAGTPPDGGVEAITRVIATHKAKAKASAEKLCFVHP